MNMNHHRRIDARAGNMAIQRGEGCEGYPRLSAVGKALRGRPAGSMTHRRKQVLDEYRAMAMRGEAVRWAELARRCGLWSYNDARRIVDDLKRIGAI